MNILDTIVAHKKKEVEQAKANRTQKDLELSDFYNRETYSLSSFIKDQNRTGIIAEFKRKSPSKGMINAHSDVIDVTTAYSNGGASCLSVLTDNQFFGGAELDLKNARINNIPILRKDFIVDEYQILESKAIGADVILLIAACLSKSETKKLSYLAYSLGLSILLELHDEEELDHVNEYTNIIGINNRNLKTFDVDIDKSIKMAEQLGADMIKVAESGISKPEDVVLFKKYGFDGFLIGENFMKHDDPG
ncbi:MAG: indole-3-glycerol phosphate synthase TrpC, partial [Chitinophagaceae bacterium]